MPPQIALMICLISVLFLLSYDAKQSRGVSPALWIPTVWCLYIASKPLGVWFGTTGDSEGGSSLDRMFLIGLLLAGFIVLIRRKPNWSTIFRTNRALILMLIFMLVSIMWSQIPGICFKRWVRELTAVIMALVVLTDPVPGAAMQSILRRSIYVMIPFSMLLIKYYPAFGAQYGRWSGQLMWIGVTMQKNGLGRLCLVSAFFIIWTLIRRRQGRDIPSGKYQTVMEVVLLAVTLWLLKGPGVQAYSATGVVALCSGIVTFLGLMWSRRFGINPKRIIQPAAAVLIIYGAATPMIYGGFLAGGVTSALGRDASFTGRTEIWAGLLPIVESHPILGAGFGGFWTRDNIRAHEITEAHNGYLDIMLDLGVMGLILISIFYLHICRQALSGLEIDFDWAALTICMVIMTIIHNFTESSINTLTSQLSALVMFLAVSFPAALKKVS